jgi:NAD(P)-dependent dehydrogenase (short-subunit alcohol dehydrogenase family)
MPDEMQGTNGNQASGSSGPSARRSEAPNAAASGIRIPDQAGRTAIITGGSSGIGRAIAEALAARGARVVIAARDQERADAVAAHLPGTAEGRRLDLSSLASIRDFAASIDEPVDLLINNAGTMSATRQCTEDGFERQFAVNHLGHFALTNLLLGRITGRVVSTSSNYHRRAHIDFDDLQWERRAYHAFEAYGQSKLAVLLFVTELQRRLAESGSPLLATAADPGWVASEFKISTGNKIQDTAYGVGTRLFAQNPHAGAQPTLLAAVGDVQGGAYAGPRWFGVRGPATLIARSAEAADTDTAKRLWDVCAELTGIG